MKSRSTARSCGGLAEGNETTRRSSRRSCDAHALGFDVVAEGVEHQKELAFLNKVTATNVRATFQQADVR